MNVSQNLGNQEQTSLQIINWEACTGYDEEIF